ncbi:MAG: outer membrane lipoprotein chaperone LolA [Chromatiales bacterium]|nr:outer membrane lipoprotein chaperone LolA [Chromatiales bacterium]
MMKPLLQTLLLLLLLAAQSAWAGRGEERLDFFFQNVVTLKADFTQTVTDEDDVIVQEAAGRMKLLRPGRFRWDYETPFSQTIVADGQFVWIYDRELAQASVRGMGEALGSTPIVLLSESRPLGEDFTIIEETTDGDMDWVVIVPKMKDTDFHRIRFGLDSEGLKQMVLFDQFGQRTVIRFSNMRVNEQISAADFRFEAPPGVDVIRGE